MKIFIRNLSFGLVVAVVAAIGLFELGALAAPKVTQQAVVKVFTTATDVVNPVPSPSPTQLPSPSPIQTTPVNLVSPTPIGPQPFPAPAANPNPAPAPNPPAISVGSPTPPVVTPTNAVYIGASVPSNEPQHCTPTPGCPAPFTVTWVADFQGGFAGIAPTFAWSDGTVGPTDTITYTTAGTYSISVKADEVYNGVTYEVGTAVSPTIVVI